MKITLNNYASALREGLYSLKDALVGDEPNSIISRDFDYVQDLTSTFNDSANTSAIRKIRKYYDGRDVPSKARVANRLKNVFGRECSQVNCKPKLTDAHYQSMLYNAVHNYLSDDLLNTDSVSVTVTDFEKVQDFADAFQDHDSVKNIKAVRKYYDEPARPAQHAVNQLLADKFQAVVA